MKREFSVGLIFLVALVALGYMMSRVVQGVSYGGGKQSFFALVKDSTGLPLGAAVRVAGVDVGRMKERTLEQGQARLRLEIAGEMKIRQDARITIRSIGYLGDRYLDLFPGSGTAPLLAEGSVIPTDESATFEGLMRQGSDFLSSWTEVARSIHRLLGVD